MSSVARLLKTTFGDAGPMPIIKIGRHVSGKPVSLDRPKSAGCHGKWDKLIGFAVALAMHSLLFLGLWRHGKVHAPSSPTTVSIVYLGPSEQGKAGGVDAPKAIRPAPAKQKPTRTDSPVSAKPTVSTVRVPAPAAEAAPARQMVEPTGVPGMASSPTASGSTNVGHSAAVVQATQSVLLSGELSVSCSERTTPAYPKLSLRLGEQGRTLLLVELDERGRVANVSVKSGSGFPRLDEAAVSAVRSWRCTPAMRDGVAVRAVAMQPFNFSLTGH
jgi:protein TonB